MRFLELEKLKSGDKVAVLSPSFAAPGVFPPVFELGLSRLRKVFGLNPIEFPTTRAVGASPAARAHDMIAAFSDPEIKAVFASIGGDDQAAYVYDLPTEPFISNPKPFFGFSDNSHFANMLWCHGIPSYYGGAVMTQFAMQVRMDAFTTYFLKKALFESGEIELRESEAFNDIGLDWSDPSNLERARTYEPNEGWFWNGAQEAEGITWGGCLSSLSEMLHQGLRIPSLDEFKDVILLTETSEDLPSADSVREMYIQLGEHGILERVRGVLVGRPKAWEFDNPNNSAARRDFREAQRNAIFETVRRYNLDAPIVQNLDFGHTDPQIPMPYGAKCRISSESKQIMVTF